VSLQGKRAADYKIRTTSDGRSVMGVKGKKVLHIDRNEYYGG